MIPNLVVRHRNIRQPHTPMGQQQGQVRLPRNRLRPRPAQLSVFSSPPIDNSLFFANDFMLGAGMVILQPSSGKVVLVYDTQDKYWFLPRGRKDVGETLEQTALREAHEEVRCSSHPHFDESDFATSLVIELNFYRSWYLQTHPARLLLAKSINVRMECRALSRSTSVARTGAGDVRPRWSIRMVDSI